jgi:hypothetical protein
MIKRSYTATFWADLRAAVLLFAFIFVAPEVRAQTFTDGFEGASISSLWTASGPGSATLTNSIAHSGSQSLQLSASPSYPYQVNVIHDFGSDKPGSASVWIQGQQLCCGSADALTISNTAGDKWAEFAQGGNTNCNSCLMRALGMELLQTGEESSMQIRQLGICFRSMRALRV